MQPEWFCNAANIKYCSRTRVIYLTWHGRIIRLIILIVSWIYVDLTRILVWGSVLTKCIYNVTNRVLKLSKVALSIPLSCILLSNRQIYPVSLHFAINRIGFKKLPFTLTGNYWPTPPPGTCSSQTLNFTSLHIFIRNLQIWKLPCALTFFEKVCLLSDSYFLNKSISFKILN